MGTRLRLLLVEDSDDDAALVLRELSEGGYEVSVKRVETAASMRAALAEQEWDVALIDYAMPQFSGIEALRLFAERGLDLPRIIISGAMGEEEAADVMRCGAHDLILKGNLGRLVPAVERELRDAEGRRQRRQAEEALAAERERLAVTLRSIGDGVIATDADGRVALVSKLAEQMTGWSQARARGKALTDVFAIAHERTHEACADPVKQVLETGEMVALPQDAALLSADGTVRPIAGTSAPVRDAASKIVGVVVVFRDMSEKRRMDEAMLRASKLESLTLLAGGIGHDFNNILTALMGNISLARRQADPDDGVFQRLVGAEKACVQAKSLTQQLLTFAKGGAPTGTTASLGELLTECTRFALRGSSVRCDLAIPDDLWPVTGDQGQMSQVMNNVIINAKEAMPGGGAMAVCAENVVVGKGDVPGLAAGAYVRVRITDEGTGIPPADLSVIFDPYFTTKPEGSGLGLATAQSIVKQHDGEIIVESTEGVGTTFALYLPASESRPAAERNAEEAERRGKGRVLVMDDEKTVRELTGDMLAHLGYEVGFAANGAEAIAAYSEAKESGEPFDALVMDLTIPGAMGGREAIKRLRELDPEVKAVVSSGYATDPIMTDFSEHGFCACVAKPYRLEELGEALQQAIAGGGK